MAPDLFLQRIELDVDDPSAGAMKSFGPCYLADYDIYTFPCVLKSKLRPRPENRLAHLLDHDVLIPETSLAQRTS